VGIVTAEDWTAELIEPLAINGGLAIAKSPGSSYRNSYLETLLLARMEFPEARGPA
jgi:hypothetical protein